MILPPEMSKSSRKRSLFPFSFDGGMTARSLGRLRVKKIEVGEREGKNGLGQASKGN